MQLTTLKRHYTYATLYGNNVLCRGWSESEGYFNNKYPFKPTFYLKTDKPTEYRTLDGIPVAPVQPGSIRDCKDFLQRYKDVEGVTVYGMEKILYQFLSEEFRGDVNYEPEKIKLWSLDIETTAENGFPNIRVADQEILLISLKNFQTKDVYTFGCGEFITNNSKIHYLKCNNEKHLLHEFLTWWRKEEPEVITGWNIEGFDIPYLYNRINLILGETDAKSLSPWKFVLEKEVEVNNRKEQRFDVVGVSVLDYLAAYKKFAFINRASYKLDAIAEIELGEKKLDHSEYDTFQEFYTKNWQKFTEYNIRDVNLVDKLEEKMKLIELIMLISYDSHCNYEDTFRQVRLWDVIIYNFLKEKNIVLSPVVRSEKNDQYEGAYVKEPIPGAYNWIVNFDLNSLYPSLIRFLNISPETLYSKIHVNKEDLIQKKDKLQAASSDLTIAANGCMYRKDILGFMPELVKKIYDERVQYKNNMLDAKRKYEQNPTKQLSKEIAKWSNFQMARKIQLNSLYGAIGNQYFRHYRVDNAEAITVTGQVAIRWIERKLNEYLNKVLKTTGFDYVAYVDTDSVYLNLGPLVESIPNSSALPTNKIVEMLDSFTEAKLIPFIDSSYDELAEYLNAYDNTMVMKREAIAEKGIWSAKKRYILNVWDNEGVRYKEAKLKMMGIEAVKSSTPVPCREYITDCLKIFMNGTEDQLIAYINEKRKEFKSLPVEDIAFPRTANNISQFICGGPIGYKKSTPYHVRGSISFNKLIKEKNLTNRYSNIRDGDKVKFVFLKIPNPTHENIIAFPKDLPTELGLTRYLDYDMMYQKGFIDPLQTIMDAVGWHTEKQVTLESFFA
ncbi:DNA polymerase [Synechococcus phage S-CRM01]|uniref:DNA polymerase n=1 Tax=Synechococcus phage S-CRM01 TaxID=1026955 RepID=UPI000209E3DF|nr:DNA polymerase [Synechococcus phage S-CRM01]AEC53088.1 DNA polymerase [Synechococcus phage S-CRM01]